MLTPKNMVILEGRITRKPVFIGDPAKGTPFLEFTLAQNEKFKRNPSDESWETHENFFKVVATGDQAKAIFKKGDAGTPVRISGKLQYNTWKDRDDVMRSETVVFAMNAEWFDIFSPPKSTAQ